MQALRQSSVVRLVLIPLMIVLWLTGCAKWSQPGKPIDQVIRVGDPPSRVRVTRSDFSQVVIESPRLENETIRGWAPSLGDTVSLELSDVRNVEIRKTNWWTTGALIYLGVGVVVTAIACADSNGYYC